MNQATDAHAADISAKARSEIAPILLDRDEAAAACRLGVEAFEAVQSLPWWTASAITLGPRTRRWIHSELEVAFANAPRVATEKRAEPAELLRARVQRLKTGG